MEKKSSLLETFRAEWLKIKGLGLLYMAIIFAVLIPVLIFGVSLFNEDARLYDGLPVIVSTREIVDSIGQFGGFFMLLFIIIAATRITQTDHKNNGWTFLETQPASKLNIYSSKFLVLASLSFIMLAVYFIACILISNLSLLLFPQQGVAAGVELYFQFHSFVRLFVLSLGIISFQLMLSVVITGFVWPFAIGFVGFVINIVGAIRRETYDFSPYNVIQTGLNYKNSANLNNFFNYSEYLSLFYAIIFFITGYFWYSKRGFKSAFLSTPKTKLISLSALVIFGLLYFLITKPVYAQKLDNRSVISGTIISPKPVKIITVTSQEFGDKIAEIPVENGAFSWETAAQIPFANYYINFEGKSYPFVFAKGDQIIFKINMDAKQSTIVVKGSRKAEDEFMKKDAENSDFYSETVQQKLYTDEPALFYSAAEKDFKKALKALDDFRTKENIYIADDFKKYQKQLIAVQMFSAVYDYQRITSFSDQKFAPPKTFATDLNNLIEKPSPLLYASDTFKDYKLKELLPKNGTKNPDSIVFVRLAKMPSGIEKDQLLSAQILKVINLENNEEKRNLVFQNKISAIENVKFKTFLINKLQIINNQQKGKAFPDLKFQDIDGKAVNIADFRGKFVVIDFWATWCGPCKETTPVFEYQAMKNEYNSDIVFLSASIDEDKSKWKLDIKNNKSKVKQWWVADQDILKAMGVTSIPRFVMLDKEGKIFNANMPRPNETNFEDILEKAVGKSYRYSML